MRKSDISILQSDMNPNMEVVIIPLPYLNILEKFSVSEIASSAYEDWFENERDDVGDSAIGDYIESRLEEKGYILGEHYKMYFDAQWDRTEILV